jgi:hypothetical protein
MSNRSRHSRSDVLPVITLEVEPADGADLQWLLGELTAFAHEHELAEAEASRFISVASDVVEVVADALDAPPVGRLQADADIGRDDVQLVLIATDHRLSHVHTSMRRLEGIASRCDDFATQLTRASELQVWASFRRGNNALP